MNRSTRLLSLTLPCVLTALSACSPGAAGNGPSPTPVASGQTQPGGGGNFNGRFAITDHGTFAEPWAAAFAPGTSTLFITEKGGTIRGVDTASGRRFNVTGAPDVDYGGQGGLGDIAFLPAEAGERIDRRTVYLSWAEGGPNDTRGAAVGRGTLVCGGGGDCRIDGLSVIWRQTPKVTGRGHYSHRLAVSPDGRYLYVSSGDRQKMEPAQDNTNTLGTVVRLNLDGTPAAGNPFADRPAPTNAIWSYGHRNVLGLAFDERGRLWEMEHGPAGGDELNIIQPGGNYGWPLVSGGSHYDGRPIPDHTAADPYVDPVVNWTPVIAPGDFIIYRGTLFPGWRGDALFAGLKSEALVRADINGETAAEAGRYPMGRRLREIVEGPDGAIWVLEDGENGRLRRLAPAS